MREVTQKSAPDGSWETIEGRADLWVRGDQPIGLCYNRIRDALQRGYRDRLHFIDYDDLTRRPGPTLAGIYEFLGERPFTHDFNNVAQVTWDLDEMYAIPNLPGIRPRVTPTEPKWPTVLGPWATKFAGNNHLWRQFRAEATTVGSASLMAAPRVG
jgi:sulfotransferase